MKIGTVWDRTLDVLNGRAAILATIAALALLLPPVISQAAEFALDSSGPPRVVTAILGIATLVFSLWGALALTAVAIDPGIDRDGALRRGGARLPIAMGTIVVLGIGLTLLFVPGFLLLASAGVDLTAVGRGAMPMPQATAGLGGFALFSLAYGIFAVWAGARLALLYPVLIDERAGLGSIWRSFALTRGLAPRIVGVLILYAIVLGVVFFAATAITGVVFRLVLGSEQAALVAFLVTVVGGVVTAVFGVLQSVFSAQLYVLVCAARDRSSALK